jgi:response regulator RpfG family c-di-GMP phosphodiesterase
MDVSQRDPIDVLIVDSDSRAVRTVRSCFPAPRFHCVTASGGEQALELVRQSRFDVVLCEIRLPDTEGMEVLRQGLAVDPQAVFVMVSAHRDWTVAVEAMKLGAYDCLEKPFAPDQLTGSVERALERSRLKAEQDLFYQLLEQTLQERTEHLYRALEQVEESQRSTLETLVVALDSRERQTHLHSLRVQAFTLRLAEKCGYSRALMKELSQGALLHDIGKIVVPDAILMKPGRLTPEEFHIMQQHPLHGHQMLTRIPHLQQAAVVALCHHEKVDGTGYPLGLKGGEIPLAARIFSVADTLDVITAGRSYCPARPLTEARLEIVRCAGAQFDPDVVEVFMETDDQEWLALREAVAQRYGTLYQPLTAPPAFQPLPY